LLERGLSVYAYEVKSAQTYHPDFHNNLKYLRDLLKDTLVESKVIYAGDYEIADSNLGLINFRHI